MSVLSALSSQLAGAGRGFSKFPPGTSIVRLASLETKTQWNEDKPVTFMWDKNDPEDSTVPGLLIDARFVVVGDGPDSPDSRPMSIKNIVLPLEFPSGVTVEDINTSLETYKKGESSPLPGGYWKFRGARELAPERRQQPGPVLLPDGRGSRPVLRDGP